MSNGFMTRCIVRSTTPRRRSGNDRHPRPREARRHSCHVTALADVVAASQNVAGTSSRSRKTAILADLLRALQPGEVPIVVGFLTGVPRQGRVGVGYATVYGVEQRAAAEASLAVGELDRA